jgi:hypothetical protein
MDTSEDPSSSKRKSRLVLGILWTGRKVGSLFLWSVRRVGLAFSWSVRNVGLGWTVFFVCVFLVCVFLVIVLATVNSPPPSESGTSSEPSAPPAAEKSDRETFSKPSKDLAEARQAIESKDLSTLYCPARSFALVNGDDALGAPHLELLTELSHFADRDNSSMADVAEILTFINTKFVQLPKSTKVRIISGEYYKKVAGQDWAACKVEIVDSDSPTIVGDQLWISFENLSVIKGSVNPSVSTGYTNAACPSEAAAVVTKEIDLMDEVASDHLDVRSRNILNDLIDRDSTVIPKTTLVRIIGKYEPYPSLCSVVIISLPFHNIDLEDKELWITPSVLHVVGTAFKEGSRVRLKDFTPLYDRADGPVLKRASSTDRFLVTWPSLNHNRFGYLVQEYSKPDSPCANSIWPTRCKTWYVDSQDIEPVK